MCVKHHPQYQIPDIVDYVRLLFLRLVLELINFLLLFLQKMINQFRCNIFAAGAAKSTQNNFCPDQDQLRAAQGRPSVRNMSYWFSPRPHRRGTL